MMLCLTGIIQELRGRNKGLGIITFSDLLGAFVLPISTILCSAGFQVGEVP